jgi:hypothetical protein
VAHYWREQTVTGEDEAWRAEEAEEAEDRQRCWDDCYARIVALAREIFDELDDDHDLTWAMFAHFAEEIKPPANRGRPPKRSNPVRDDALIKAYREAPPGERRARVIAAGGAHRMSPEAAWMQIRRLRKEARDRWAWLPAHYRPLCWANDENK